MNRTQLAKTCVVIEKAGGNVLEYLRGCGCISPWGTWYRLQREELCRKGWEIKDGKGGRTLKKITLEMKKKAVEIALDGGNPLTFLRQCGSKAADQAWYMIKQDLKKADPEKYAKIPQRVNGKKEETTMATEEESTKSTEEPEDDQPEEAQQVAPLKHMDFKVTGIDTHAGQFARSGNMIRFIPAQMDMKIDLTIDQWKQLADILPQMLAILE